MFVERTNLDIFYMVGQEKKLATFVHIYFAL